MKNAKETTEPAKEVNKTGVLSHAKGALQGIREYIYHFFHIKDDVDIPGTIGEIKKGLDFGGARAWILMGAIIIASIGLNMGQMAIAVIIGAMLIAPLISPILMAGIALGTNDWGNLKKSSTSLLQAIGISLVGSFIWFLFSPINAASDAIIVRTIPTLYDVIVAAVGGAVCIIAMSLKDKGLAATVIPGVAVATSLMPPLCTAGFGLAHANLGHFIGGFYLFILNAVFIAFSAYMFAKLMKFPKIHLESAETEARHKKYIFVSLALIVIPSIWVFVGIVKDSVFESDAHIYVEEVVKYDGSNIIEYEANREENTIEVFMIGEVVPEDVQRAWRNSLAKYDLDGVELKVSQSKETIIDEHLSADFIEQMYKDKDIQLHEKDEKIKFLEAELSKKKKKNEVNLLAIEKEIQINYDKIQKLSYSESQEVNFNGSAEIIPTFMVKWEPGYKGVSEDSKKLGQWLELRLKIDSPRIINY